MNYKTRITELLTLAIIQYYLNNYIRTIYCFTRLPCGSPKIVPNSAAIIKMRLKQCFVKFQSSACINIFDMLCSCIITIVFIRVIDMQIYDKKLFTTNTIMDPEWARYERDSKNHAKHLPILRTYVNKHTKNTLHLHYTIKVDLHSTTSGLRFSPQRM